MSVDPGGRLVEARGSRLTVPHDDQVRRTLGEREAELPIDLVCRLAVTVGHPAEVIDSRRHSCRQREEGVGNEEAGRCGRHGEAR